MRGRWIVWMLAVAGLAGTAAEAAAQVRLGGRVGLASSTLVGDDIEEDEVDSHGGLTAGVWLELPIFGPVSIQPELSFTEKGVEVPDDPDIAGLSINYLEVPLLVKVRIPTGTAFQPHVSAGPLIGFERSCEVEQVVNGEDREVDCESAGPDDPVETESIDGGLALGAGFDLRAGPGAIVVDGRLHLGLTTIDGSAEENDVRNRVWSIQIGYGIALGGR